MTKSVVGERVTGVVDSTVRGRGAAQGDGAGRTQTAAGLEQVEAAVGQARAGAPEGVWRRGPELGAVRSPLPRRVGVGRTTE